MVRKFLLRINVSLLLLIVISMCCSCTNEMNILEGNNNEQINFAVSVPEWLNTDSLSNLNTSRATPITDASLSTSNTFNLIADQNDGAGNYSTLIDKEAVSFINNIWQTTPSHYYWSGIANKTVNFYAYYPTSISSNISHTAGSAPTLSYTVPDDANNQIDIITATTNNVSGNTNSSTPLTFNHIFAAVKFRSGSLGLPSGNNTIIKIKGIQYKGIYTFNNGWVNFADIKDFSQNVNLTTFGVSTDIINDGTTFMMLPQILSNVTIEVTYNNGLVLSKTISGKWEADNVYTYNLSKSITCEYGYNGNYQTFTAPYSGVYKIECWGASGGSINSYMGGKGAYTEGYLYLISNKSLFLYVGGEGSCDTNGGFNGGGAITPGAEAWGRSGGGATDVRLESSNWNDFIGLKSRIMVAAGGGGADDRNYTETGTPFGCGDGGFGGSLTGGDGVHVPHSDSEGWYCLTYGAHQTYGGTGIEYKNGGSTNYNSGRFGSVSFDETIISQAGGGGGYYGGASSHAHCGGSGGASFVSGCTGCNAIKATSTATAIEPSDTPNHYSGYVFTNSTMIAGNTSMPAPGGGYEIGHSGNGYARITFVSAN